MLPPVPRLWAKRGRPVAGESFHASFTLAVRSSPIMSCLREASWFCWQVITGLFIQMLRVENMSVLLLNIYQKRILKKRAFSVGRIGLNFSYNRIDSFLGMAYKINMILNFFVFVLQKEGVLPKTTLGRLLFLSFCAILRGGICLGENHEQ